MKTEVYKANTRGHANHGWLKSYHSFSFANYQDPNRMNFGVLRVLNDDTVTGGRGFGTHPHNNMEIISIPLQGDLKHMDDMGNATIIKEGDVQVMSAGTGITHSEYNNNPDKEVKFLQIWVIPNARNVTPRYDQISLESIRRENSFYQILSPNKEDQGVWIHQDAWFSMGEFEEKTDETYTLKKESNGVFLFVIEGTVTINEQKLENRDSYAIVETINFKLVANTKATVLLMEVPMKP